MTGETLKKLRKAAKLTQPALADQLGIHWQTVAHYEQGHRPIPVPMSKLIALILTAKKGRR
jgi:DNA-binding transcriptional regulator YiaG